MVTLYKSESCPQCKILKMKLEKKNIPFIEVIDMATLEEKGITSIPQLQIDNGPLMSMGEANKWINAQEVWNG